MIHSFSHTEVQNLQGTSVLPGRQEVKTMRLFRVLVEFREVVEGAQEAGGVEVVKAEPLSLFGRANVVRLRCFDDNTRGQRDLLLEEPRESPLDAIQVRRAPFARMKSDLWRVEGSVRLGAPTAGSLTKAARGGNSSSQPA